jgi:hypothetical protein
MMRPQSRRTIPGANARIAFAVPVRFRGAFDMKSLIMIAAISEVLLGSVPLSGEVLVGVQRLGQRREQQQSRRDG